MSEPNPKTFLDYFEKKIEENKSYDPHNIKESIIDLIIVLKELKKITDNENSALEEDITVKLKKKLNNIHEKYLKLYKHLKNFSIRYLEKTLDNTYILKPLLTEASIEERKILINKILKYQVLFDIYKYYLVLLFEFKASVLTKKGSNNIDRITSTDIKDAFNNTSENNIFQSSTTTTFNEQSLKTYKIAKYYYTNETETEIDKLLDNIDRNIVIPAPDNDSVVSVKRQQKKRQDGLLELVSMDKLPYKPLEFTNSSPDSNIWTLDHVNIDTNITKFHEILSVSDKYSIGIIFRGTIQLKNQYPFYIILYFKENDNYKYILSYIIKFNDKYFYVNEKNHPIAIVTVEINEDDIPRNTIILNIDVNNYSFLHYDTGKWIPIPINVMKKFYIFNIPAKAKPDANAEQLQATAAPAPPSPPPRRPAPAAAGLAAPPAARPVVAAADAAAADAAAAGPVVAAAAADAAAADAAAAGPAPPSPPPPSPPPPSPPPVLAPRPAPSPAPAAADTLAALAAEAKRELNQVLRNIKKNLTVLTVNGEPGYVNLTLHNDIKEQAKILDNDKSNPDYTSLIFNLVLGTEFYIYNDKSSIRIQLDNDYTAIYLYMFYIYSDKYYYIKFTYIYIYHKYYYLYQFNGDKLQLRQISLQNIPNNTYILSYFNCDQGFIIQHKHNNKFITNTISLKKLNDSSIAVELTPDEIKIISPAAPAPAAPAPAAPAPAAILSHAIRIFITKKSLSLHDNKYLFYDNYQLHYISYEKNIYYIDNIDNIQLYRHSIDYIPNNILILKIFANDGGDFEFTILKWKNRKSCEISKEEIQQIITEYAIRVAQAPPASEEPYSPPPPPPRPLPPPLVVESDVNAAIGRILINYSTKISINSEFLNYTLENIIVKVYYICYNGKYYVIENNSYKEITYSSILYGIYILYIGILNDTHEEYYAELHRKLFTENITGLTNNLEYLVGEKKCNFRLYIDKKGKHFIGLPEYIKQPVKYLLYKNKYYEIISNNNGSLTLSIVDLSEDEILRSVNYYIIIDIINETTFEITLEIKYKQSPLFNDYKILPLCNNFTPDEINEINRTNPAIEATLGILRDGKSLFEGLPELGRQVAEDLFGIIRKGGANEPLRALPKILQVEYYKDKIEPFLSEVNTTSNNLDSVKLAPLSRNPLGFDNESKIFRNRDRKSLVYWQRTFNNIVNKLKNNSKISTKEIDTFNSIENSVNSVEIKDDDKNKEKREAKRKALIEYIKTTKEELEKQNIGFKDENIINTNKIILDFSKVVNVFKIILVGLTVISIIIYIVVLIISIYNLFNLLIKIIGTIIYLFYNKTLTHLDTLSYKAKNITKCTKDNYSGDIFNVLNEQLTALSVFNTNIYIIYIILGYVILYLLYFIYSLIFSKFYVFKGDIKDIDPKFTLLTVIAIIFMCSFFHLLIYKFLFKTICLNKFKECDKDETNIDDKLKTYLSSFKDIDEPSENTKFYNLLTDSTKKEEIDAKFQNMVLDLEEDRKSNLGKYLLIYDLYIYFQDYLYMDDKKKELIKDKFDEMMKGDTCKTSFVSVMDLNERRLIKSYHQELPFYNQIPSEKSEYFKIIDTNIGDLLTSANKSIITYAGTFYPFLFTCIYILIICIYNIITTYIILKHISDNKEEQIFPQFIYTMADKIIDIVNRIYNLFNN